jgi:hypothetical protein
MAIDGQAERAVMEHGELKLAGQMECSHSVVLTSEDEVESEDLGLKASKFGPRIITSLKWA